MHRTTEVTMSDKTVVGRSRIGSITALALLAVLVIGACRSDPGSPDAVPPADPTLAAIRSDIFHGACAVGGCHAEPMLSARLDLGSDGLCHLLVSHKSCLFANKILVVPGKPEASFLLDKLRGTGLDGTPDVTCATSNERMPFGQPPLPDSKIAQIEAWIRAGASCGDGAPVDAGAGGDAPGDGEALADVASITPASTSIHVGESTQVTVTFTHGAPTAGQTLILEVDDGNVLDVPASRYLDPGTSSITFDVLGKAAGWPTITASSGTNSMTLTITVTSLTLSDDPQPAVRLAGVHPVPRRVVIVSQARDASNGNPAYGSSIGLSPILLNSPVASQISSIEVVLYGQSDLAGLRGTVGLSAASRCPGMAAGGNCAA
jgi:hypothetical protein